MRREAGIIGSMAWFVEGDHLRIVRFTRSESLRLDVQQGHTFSTKPVQTYTQAKQQRVVVNTQRKKAVEARS